MKILVTGSAGHLGEALVRLLQKRGDDPVGIDIKKSAFTHYVGSICNRDFVSECVSQVEGIIHTATLHKPHVGTHTRQDFVDTNISGTLNLLEEAHSKKLKAFVFTSSTSTFGDAMKPEKDGAAVWVTEELVPVPKNIYGVTKLSAEELCRLFSRKTDLPCIVLKTSRFFPEEDDDQGKRDTFSDENLKVNELLFRRCDVEDIADAHTKAVKKAEQIGFARLILTATTPFNTEDAMELRINAPRIVERYVPEYVSEYDRRNWTMFPEIHRVYDNSLAREMLEWEPHYSFQQAIRNLSCGLDVNSDLARDVGKKGYHERAFEHGPYPVKNF